MKNGSVYILKDTWKIDTLQNTFTGSGIQYDLFRKKINDGTLTIPIDSVAIFETNKKPDDVESNRIAGLSIMAGLDVIIGIICLTNPKACFGSCPTFYIHENDNFHYADAEGFSNAISPSMEYGDIDALNNLSVPGTSFTLTMKNEALETHCIKDIKLLAYPVNGKEKVYQTPANDFYLCSDFFPLKSALAGEGNITSLLQYEDRQERFSLSDKTNLNSKEEIYLDFKNVNAQDDLGLIVHFRQTLMTTYFIYSAMGFMGDEVGDVFAKLENDISTVKKLNGGIKKCLGNIDVFLWDKNSNEWVFQNSLYETGPIAINKQMILLRKTSAEKEIKLKLILNKGLWRMDYLALAHVIKKVTPISLFPSSVMFNGRINTSALSDLQNTQTHLISLPGNEFKFNFTLPEGNRNYELFLYSKGYYLEWMRQHWIRDKNLLKLKQMIDNPNLYLKNEAGNYKKYEETMEQEFWNSKIETKTFSVYEN